MQPWPSDQMDDTRQQRDGENGQDEKVEEWIIARVMGRILRGCVGHGEGLLLNSKHHRTFLANPGLHWPRATAELCSSWNLRLRSGQAREGARFHTGLFVEEAADLSRQNVQREGFLQDRRGIVDQLAAPGGVVGIA